MSDSEDSVPQTDVAKVAEMAIEPSYVSEIARKLILADEDWSGMGLNSAIVKVAKVVNVLDERMDMVVGQQPSDLGGQKKSSPKRSVAGGHAVDLDEWLDYKVIHNPGIPMAEIREGYREYVDPNVTFEDKMEMIRRLSEIGNEVSVQAEEIMQDVMERQFKEYETVEVSDYNDPGVDFYVQDEGKRKWGLAIEVSVRWVNPIGAPYVESKKDDAFERDSDLIIIAPKFTDGMISKHEDPSMEFWHRDPEGERVHLHTVPSDSPAIYRPFATDVESVEDEFDRSSGNPVIIPDSEGARRMMQERGNVGEGYPVVDGDMHGFRDLLTEVRRDYMVVTESMYRNYIREAIEPALWEFLRPYKIEQFLLDMYWDKELTQSRIGRLVDRSGSTIGDWMRKWGVMRRGTGAPELGGETEEIWSRMYRGEEPFPSQFSGYRIQAEYNRHPLWTIEDWENWYGTVDESERKEIISYQDSYRNNLDYTIMLGAGDRLLPSYTFILSTLKDIGVEIREPDEAPRVPYSAYPSGGTLEYMINRNQDTIVELEGE